MRLRQTQRAKHAALALMSGAMIALHSLHAGAQPRPETIELNDEQKALFEQAKVYFKKGQALFDKKDWDGALAQFLQAYKLFPRWTSASYAAQCLQNLGRYDEALDQYETLMVFFKGKLPPDAPKEAAKRIEEARGFVGTIEIEDSEVDAMVVVDLRRHGGYPLAPIRVPIGTHIVRVYKEGFEPFETRVEVAGRTTVQVPARLAPLAVTGRLQVFETSGKILDVIVDGFVVGQTGVEAWQGLVAPGEHTIALQGDGDIGTQPVTIRVERDPTTPVRLQAESLTSALSIRVTPASATIALDGVNLGHGLWAGKLKPGKHRVEIAAEGFILYVKDLVIAANGHEVINATLERDPLHPLWQDNRGRFFVEGALGMGAVPTMGGKVIEQCTGSCGVFPGFGMALRGRGGYRFPSGFMVGGEVSYLYARQKMTGREAFVIPLGLPANPGTADDTLAINGVVLGGFVGIKFGKKLPLRFGVGGGFFLGQSKDRRRGSFNTCMNSDGSECQLDATYSVDKTQKHTLTGVYVAPEAKLLLPLRERLEFSVGIEGFLLLPLRGRDWLQKQTLIYTGVEGHRDGQGTFPQQQYLGNAIIGVQLGAGLRYEF